MRGFDLIVCIDFLLRLSVFFTLPADESPRDTAESPHVIEEAARGAQRSFRHSTSVLAKDFRSKELLGKDEVQRPFVKSPLDGQALLSSSCSSRSQEDEPHPAHRSAGHYIGGEPGGSEHQLHHFQCKLSCFYIFSGLHFSSLTLQAQAHLNFRSINEKQIVNGQIDALKMYMCAFLPERREMTRHYILHPCVISLQGSTPEEEGMHISLKLSDIIINVSPATIELLNKAMVSVSSGSKANQAVVEDSRNYSTIWKQRHFQSRNFWFTRVEQGVEALELEDSSSTQVAKTEKCVIEMPSITLVIESGVGYYTKPLISLDTRITAVFNNWSSNLTAQGSLTLNMVRTSKKEIQ